MSAACPIGSRPRKPSWFLEKEFSFGRVTPAYIVIDGEIDSEPVQKGIQRLQAAMASDPAFVGPHSFEKNATGDLALLSMPVAGDPSGDVALDAVARLRDDYVPEAFSGANARVLVTGVTAFNIAHISQISRVGAS